MQLRLNQLAQIYLEDREFQDYSRAIIQSRNDTTNTLKNIVSPFSRGESFLQDLSRGIKDALPPNRDTWNIRNTDFLLNLDKTSRYYAEHIPDVEQRLRDIFADTRIEMLGEGVERWYHFLHNARQVLLGKNVPLWQIVSPYSSALTISLLSHWLIRQPESIYYPGLLRGLKVLLDAHLLPYTTQTRVVYGSFQVITQEDHSTVQAVLDYLAREAPQLKTIPAIGPYWAERFLLWVTEHSDLLDENGMDKLTHIVATKGLMRVLESELKAHIRELRRHVLIDAALVRRIYHALLAGHVILTGPPGTGKTETAQFIPELLWYTTEKDAPPSGYATELITATDEWSTHTLIGGIVPRNKDGHISYFTQDGLLTKTVRKNWLRVSDDDWSNDRVSVWAKSHLDGARREFHGVWLVIDEFNRAPIDVALGEALTTLGGSSGGFLPIPTNDGTKMLPLPEDFRIIGTLNSFDRSYLNQISEALKRRFSFIEISPPGRVQRKPEQAMVLYKALEQLPFLVRSEIRTDVDGQLHTYFAMFTETEQDIVSIDWLPLAECYRINWRGSTPLQSAFNETFDIMWRLIEVVRVYRQLGTAQLIALMRAILISGLMQGYMTPEQWRNVLDEALCDTIADQLQILLPDELHVLYWYVTVNRADFISRYNRQLEQLRRDSPRRLRTHYAALARVRDDNDESVFALPTIDDESSIPEIQDPVLAIVFHLDETPPVLKQFARRLESFIYEQI